MGETAVSDLVERLEKDGSPLSLEAAKALRQQYRRATDAEYMSAAYRNMLGPVGIKVADAWKARGVTRVHYDWGPEASQLAGEERAQIIADWETGTVSEFKLAE